MELRGLTPTILLASGFVLSALCQFVASTPVMQMQKWVLFDCQERDAGLYADQLRKCRVFHLCTASGQHFELECPKSHKFDQEQQDCIDTRKHHVKCDAPFDHRGKGGKRLLIADQEEEEE